MKGCFKQVGAKVESLLTAYRDEILDTMNAAGEAKVSFSIRIQPGGKATIRAKSTVQTINATADVTQDELPGVK